MNAYIVAGQVALGVYAVLLAGGGLMGYLKAGSRPSLIAGTISGVVAVLALALTWMGGLGFWVGIVLAIAMLGVFGPRLARTRKFMPAVPLIAASVLVLALMVMALRHVG